MDVVSAGTTQTYSLNASQAAAFNTEEAQKGKFSFSFLCILTKCILSTAGAVAQIKSYNNKGTNHLVYKKKYKNRQRAKCFLRQNKSENIQIPFFFSV